MGIKTFVLTFYDITCNTISNTFVMWKYNVCFRWIECKVIILQIRSLMFWYRCLIKNEVYVGSLRRCRHGHVWKCWGWIHVSSISTIDIKPKPLSIAVGSKFGWTWFKTASTSWIWSNRKVQWRMVLGLWIWHHVGTGHYS